MTFDETITVYNIIPQRGREVPEIRRKVVEGAFWDSSRGASYNKRGENESDTTTVHLHERPDCLTESEWYSKGFPADCFTLRKGDIIARGEHGDIQSADDLRARHVEFMTITNVRGCKFGSRGMWHYEVIGK